MWAIIRKYEPVRSVLRTFSTKIGFIGVGNMGGSMAENLLEKGESLLIYDTSQQSLKTFENKEKATIVSSVKEVAENSSCVITMLPGNDSVWSVYAGEDGILKNSQKENTLFIDCSTIDPGLSQKIFQLSKGKNYAFLDAPVSGGVLGAKNGSLTFMVGGCELTTKVVEPLLLKMGSKVIYCGPSGTGQAAKLCNNMLLGTTMVAVAESMNMGIKFGLDPKLLASIINSSTGRCWASDVYNPVPGIFENVPSSRNYEGGFKTSFLVKDINLALDLAKRINTSTSLATKAREMYVDAVQKGYGNSDFSVIYKYLSENSKD